MLHSPSFSHPGVLSSDLIDKFRVDLDDAHGEDFTEEPEDE